MEEKVKKRHLCPLIVQCNESQDSFEVFEDEFIATTGMTMSDFKNKAKKETEGENTVLFLDFYKLEMNAKTQTWSLYDIRYYENSLS